jgi:hypothetical protein
MQVVDTCPRRVNGTHTARCKVGRSGGPTGILNRVTPKGTIMKRSTRIVVAAVLTATMLSIASPALAKSGGTLRPFHASGTFDCTPTDCTGSGNATHLGKVTLTNDATTITAANGDQLTFVEDWSTFQYAYPGVAPCTPDEFRVQLTSSFAGGTGRFANATGTFTQTVCSSDEVHYRFFDDGQISY